VLLMIDNFDSFTWNVVRYFEELGAEVQVYRNNAITLEQIEALAPSHLVISPGPCTPAEAGISVAAIRHFAGRLPILGVCLGHQCIGQAFGAEVVRARQVMHGKTSMIEHLGDGLFKGLKRPLEVTRYHSLVVRRDSLPDCLEMTAWTTSEEGAPDEIMALQHREFELYGVQFHPESVLTEQGHALLGNFLRQA
jgi:anthranilate synthase/aminodeoxychorismate synthase-like glutamine amidotransferase